MGKRPNPQNVPIRTDTGTALRAIFNRAPVRGREELWQPGDWAYFSNLPGTVQIKQVYFPYYARALYLVAFQGREYWAFHSELE